MKPIVFKRTNFWWVMYRDGRGKLSHTPFLEWDRAIIVALLYAIYPPPGRNQ